MGSLTGNNTITVKNTKTVKALHELLGVVTLHNDRDWVRKLREILEQLIGKGFGEHLVPYKAEIDSPRNTSDQQGKFS